MKMKFVLDEMVPDGIAEFLRHRKHEVLLVREALGRETSDQDVAAFANAERAVLITWNKKHYTFLTERRPPEAPNRYPHTSGIVFVCPEAKARKRLEALLDLIEAEYEMCQKQKRDRRLLAEVRENALVIIR